MLSSKMRIWSSCVSLDGVYEGTKWRRNSWFMLSLCERFHFLREQNMQKSHDIPIMKHVAGLVSQRLQTMYSNSKVLHHRNFIQLPKHPNCGSSATKFQSAERIMIGSKDAAIGEFPWISRLGYYDTESEDGIVFRCVGSIMSDFIIVTSASCAIGKGEKEKKVEVARLGDYNLKTDIDCKSGVCADPHVDHSISSLVPHANFSEITYENNIALVKTSERMTFSEFIQPICLLIENRSKEDMKSYIGEAAWITGWRTGATDSTDGWWENTILQKTHADVMDSRDCWTCQNNTKRMGPGLLCAGRRDTFSGPCGDGDRGLPLMIQALSPPRWHLLGVYSCGYCHADYRLYTRISDHSLWILEHM